MAIKEWIGYKAEFIKGELIKIEPDIELFRAETKKIARELAKEFMLKGYDCVITSEPIK